MDYMPLTKSMNLVGAAPLDERRSAKLFDKIVSAGSVQYAFLLAVLDNVKEEPVYFVASEVNEMAAAFGGGSHYLGVFDGSGHANLGASDDWGDPRKFFPKALRMAAERFGVPFEGDPDENMVSPPTVVLQNSGRKPWWRFWG